MSKNETIIDFSDSPAPPPPLAGSRPPQDVDLQAELEFQSFILSDSGHPSSSSASRPPDYSLGSPPHPANLSQAEAAAPKAVTIWSLDYYAKYFDVDTSEVLFRILAAILPKQNFLDLISPNPDLYGPFWISTTLILVLFITSVMGSALDFLIKSQPYSPDYSLLTYAIATIYPYTFLLPLLLWGVGKYTGVPLQLLHVVGVYGYGLSVWVPLCVLTIIPADGIRWPLVIIGCAFSVFFLLRNILPLAANSSTGKTAFLVIMVSVQVAFAFMVKFLYFSQIAEVAVPKGASNTTTPSF